MSQSPAPPPPPPPPPISGPPAGVSPWFRRLTFFGLLSSVCPLIPVPFLDDWALTWVRRRMVLELHRRRGLQPSLAAVEILAGARDEKDPLLGCLRACLLWPVVKLAIYLLRKVFRKILFFLTLKDCVDAFSVTFHEGYLVHRALGSGQLPRAPEAGERRVRTAVLRTCAAVDPRPIHQLVARTLRGSRRLMRGAADLLARVLRRERRQDPDGASPGEASPPVEATLAEEEKLLGGLLDRLTAALGAETGYLAGLEARFGEELRAVDAAPPGDF